MKKTNTLIIVLVVVIFGGFIGVVLWLKNNASKILADSATDAMEEMQNKNLSLKEILRQTTGTILQSQTANINESVSNATTTKVNDFLNRVMGL